MRLKITLHLLVTFAFTAFITQSSAQTFTENFDDITTLSTSGWFTQNNSTVVGTTNWFQGDSTVFTAFNGASNSYIAADANNAPDTNNISNWLVSPVITFRNGDVITFYTRKLSIDTSADRLQVRLSTSGNSVNVGNLGIDTAVGDFTNLLLDINPTLTTGIYPTSWTQYTVTISGLSAPTTGRIAFRYFVTNGGSNGINADYIGIDNFVYTTVCVPITLSPASLSVAGVGTSYSQNLSQTGGQGVVHYDITSGSLPSGMSVSIVGVLSGIPTAIGNYAFDITATDVNGCTGVQSYTLDVSCAANPIMLSVSVIPTSICSGQSVLMSASVVPVIQNNFVGIYDPANWTIFDGNGGGVNITNAPASIAITSGDDDQSGPTYFRRGVISTLSITTITFNWNYSTPDAAPYDYPRYVINGIATILPGYNLNGGLVQSGTASVTVPAGATFALEMYTVDGTYGGATTIFSNFTGTDDSGTINWFTTSTGGTSFLTSPASVGATYVPTTLGTNDFYAEATNVFGCVSSPRSPISIVVNGTPSLSVSASATSLCAGDALTLNSTSSATTTWNNGVTDGVSFDPAVGTTTYIATATAGNGCVNTDTVTVSVHEIPVVIANASATTLCEGNNLTLSGSGADTYVWDNGVIDANSFVPTVGTVMYTVTGFTNYGCSATASNSVTVNPVPTVTCNASASTICKGQSVMVYGNGADTYAWDNDIVDSVSFEPAVGTFAYNVIGTASNGCTNTASVSVTINALPTITANASSALLCAGDLLTLNGNGGLTYFWDSTITDGVAFSTTAGTHDYIVIGTDANGCVNRDTTRVIVNPTFTTDLFYTVCPGGSVTVGSSTYSITGVYADVYPAITGCDSTVMTHLTVNTPITYNYTVTTCAGGSITVGTSTYSISGTYTDTLQAANGCDSVVTTILTIVNSITGTQTLTLCHGQLIHVGNNVYDSTGVYIDVISSAYAGCDSTVTTNLTVLPQNLNYNAFTICAGDSIVLGSQTYTTSGFYTTFYTAASGCDSIVTTTLTVNPMPVVTVTSPSGCTGSTFTITASGANTYTWSAGATAAGGSIATANPSVTTSFTVTGTSLGCSDTAVSTVTVHAQPTVTLAAFNPSTICAQTAAFALTGGLPAGGTYSGVSVVDSTFTPSVNQLGNNFVTYTYSSFGCIGAASQTIVVYNCLGVDEYSFENSVSLYPNPATNDFMLTVLNAKFSSLFITIVDVEGRLVFSSNEKTTGSEFSKQIDVEDIAKGIYFVRLNNGEEVITKKLVIQ